MNKQEHETVTKSIREVQAALDVVRDSGAFGKRIDDAERALRRIERTANLSLAREHARALPLAD